MKPVENFDETASRPGKIARVVKNIYITPHGSRIFADGLRAHLLCRGYRQLLKNQNVYVRHHGSEIIIVAVTIDDFSVATNSDRLYKPLLKDLGDKNTTENIGDAKRMIWWSLHRDRAGGAIHVSQPHLTPIIHRSYVHEHCQRLGHS